jgi:DNA-directed RNA polymerase subunit RPC12/RpoP
MKTITDIFRSFGPEYIERYQYRMPLIHQKVMESMIECRTSESGIVIYKCKDCGDIYQIYRSCGNRHCPQCQHHKTMMWVEKQFERRLPGHHFMITFTVPKQIRAFIRSHQATAYNAMFKASSEALKKLAADEKFIGGDLPGFMGVLQTWGRQLTYHPHIHYIVPGGAISRHDQRWHPSRQDFYVPVKALSKIYKAKFRDAMIDAGMDNMIPPDVWYADWIVNIQAVGNSEASIRYLSPYIFKVAISNSRIVRVEKRNITFKYKKSNSNRWRHITLDAMEFIRRFLQHVLPTGFMKIRYYGFLHPCSSISLEDVRIRIHISYGFRLTDIQIETEQLSIPVCPSCGGNLIHFASILPRRFVLRSG